MTGHAGIKKSGNTVRIKRIQAAMDELNYVDRLLRDVGTAFQARRAAAAQTVREGLLDEGFDEKMIAACEQIQVDTEAMEIRYVLKAEAVKELEKASEPLPEPVKTPVKTAPKIPAKKPRKKASPILTLPMEPHGAKKAVKKKR